MLRVQEVFELQRSRTYYAFEGVEAQIRSKLVVMLIYYFYIGSCQ